MSATSPFQLFYSLENNPPVKIDLEYKEYIIGRSSDCDIILEDLEVSRRHARITVDASGIKIADQGSANGTQLEGKPLSPRKEFPLQPGQPFRIGSYHFVLAQTGEQPVAPAHIPRAEEATRADLEEPVQTFVEPSPAIRDEKTTVDVVVPKEAQILRLTLQMQDGSTREVLLPDGEYTIGREASTEIHLDDPYVSRRHAVLKVIDQKVTLVDPGSSNGVSRGSRKLEKNRPELLEPGGTFEIGSYKFSLGKIPQSQAAGVRVPGEGAPPPAAPVSQPPARQIEARQDDSKPLNLMGLEKISIGRATDNHIVIDHPMVSRYHALIERMGTRYRIIDTHSANGVYINGERVDETGWLKEGDEIKIGLYQFNFTGTTIHQSSAEGYTIDVVNLKKYVTKTLNLLQDINLKIGQNEFVALVGMSGSGKTTLQDCINGYRPATHGQVLINGVDLYQNYDMFRNDIGYVPQRDIVHMELTPESSLDYAAQLRMPVDTSLKERKEAVRQTLQDLGLLHRKDVSNSRLSGGQLKRVSIGVELLTRPKLFFLDEPTSGLDPGTEYEMMKLLRRLADQGRTIMLITHATKNVMLCDKVIILATGGHLAYFGAPENALKYFNQHRTRREQLEKDMEFDDIYRILDDPSKGKPEEWGQRFREEAARQAQSAPAPAAKPAQKVQKSKIRRISGLRQFFILSTRNTNILFKDRISLIMLLALAPILGIFNIIWGSNLFDAVEGNVSRVMAMWFMAAVIAVLVGSMSSIREIVKEQDIYKRERAVGLKVLPYTLSKLWIGAVLSIYAGAVILFFIIILVQPSVPNILGYLSMFITMVLGIFAGYLLGLLISALVPNQNSAMIMLIAVLVPQLLFAGVLIPLENIPLGQPLSTVISTRWVWEAFVRSTGIGDPLMNDACWELDKDTRLAMSEEQKASCPCLGASIFNDCNTMPGILSADFYDSPAQAALAQPGPLKPIEPTSIPSPTAIPSPTPLPSPTSYPTPTALPQSQNVEQYMDDTAEQQEEYFDERIEQLDDYQEEIKEITSDWADEQSDQMEIYAEESKEQFEDYADDMELYGDELAAWEKERQSAIGAAESLLTTIYDNYGRAFKRSAFYRWVILGFISFAEFVLILIFIRRKDVV